jgi:hypothetical protein
MASSCLQLMTLLLQEANAAVTLGGRVATAASEAAADTLHWAARQVFSDVGPAVHHCMRGAASLKQRRQLMRLWASTLTAVAQGAGAWRVVEQQQCMRSPCCKHQTCKLGRF